MGKRLHFDLLEKIKNSEQPQESSTEETEQEIVTKEEGAE
jgi:hypothetical protein